MRISDWSSDVCSSDLTDHSALDPLIRDALARDPGFAAAEFLDLVDQTRRLDPGSGDRVAQLVDRAMRDVLPSRFGRNAVFFSGERGLEAPIAPSRGNTRWLKKLADGAAGDRKSGGEGKSVAVSVDLGGRRLNQKKKKK